ncbi:hypothetical protein Tsp_10505, partial [Trichinella spiralis]
MGQAWAAPKASNVGQ